MEGYKCVTLCAERRTCQVIKDVDEGHVGVIPVLEEEKGMQ